MAEKTKRIMSIDALRGFDMFWITGGDAFFIALFTFIGTHFSHVLATQLDHPAWSGFRFYDNIFPLFLFIVGLSMPFSITRRLEKGDSKKQLYWHIFRRTITLYVLGLVYNGLFNFDFATLRYTGVLHRIAICYFFSSLIVMNFKQKGLLIWAATITIGYWFILLLVPSPGFGSYNLTPEGNLSAFIDQKLLPGSFCCYKYGDNEGIITTLPAIVNVLIGVWAGNRLLKSEKWQSKIKFFSIISFIFIAVGIVWSFIYPVNKYLWTGPFVLLTCGISFLMLSLFYWLIDIKSYTKWAFPFVVIGMNSITIYVLQGIFDFGIIAKIFIHGFYTHMGSFQMPFYQLCILIVKWFLLYFLYKQKIFLKA